MEVPVISLTTVEALEMLSLEDSSPLAVKPHPSFPNEVEKGGFHQDGERWRVGAERGARLCIFALCAGGQGRTLI